MQSKLVNQTIKDDKNKLENFIVKKEKGRYKFYELPNQLN